MAKRRNPKKPITPEIGFLYHDESLAIFNVKTGEILGFMKIYHCKRYDIFQVDWSVAKRGYGPMLYEIAMKYAEHQGGCLRPDPSQLQSEKAKKLWKKFRERNDIIEHGSDCYQIEHVPGFGEAARRGEKYLDDIGISIEGYWHEIREWEDSTYYRMV